MLLAPIRCFTCGKEINTLYHLFIKKLKTKSSKEIFQEETFYKLRWCCKTHILTSNENIDQIFQIS